MTRCLICGNLVTPSTRGGKPKVYCGPECRRTAKNKARVGVKRAVKRPEPPRTFASAYWAGLAAGVDLLEERDAIRECVHGRLDGDLGVACACWKATA